MSAKLSEAEVLRAVSKAVWPCSLYIANEVHIMHGAHVRAGGTGHPPRVGLILRRMRSLEKSGLLECVGGPDGYYGFKWRITESGRLALALALATTNPSTNEKGTDNGVAE